VFILYQLIQYKRQPTIFILYQLIQYKIISG